MGDKLKTDIFSAVCRRRLDVIKSILYSVPKNSRRDYVSSIVFGYTPLIAACQRSSLDIIEYLIVECNADIEQPGCTSFKGQMINATPLWFAAATGDLNVVHQLIFHKAFVDATTESTSTPLLAACLYGHFEIVKYLIKNGADIEAVDSKGSTCLMVACSEEQFEIASYLISCGGNMNAKNLSLRTPLHACAVSGNCNIVQMLLDHGAKMEADEYGLTPLLTAAIECEIDVVECLIKNRPFKLIEKIDAYKLLGAAFIIVKSDVFMTYSCWKKAIKLLNQDADSLSLKPLDVFPIEAYNNGTEVYTHEQLKKIKSEEESMWLQALIMRERILGSGSPLILQHIYDRGLWYCENNNFNRCIPLWIHELALQQKFKPLEWEITEDLKNIVKCMYLFISESLSSEEHLLPTCINYMLSLFHQVIKIIESMIASPVKNKQCFDLTFIISLHLIGIFAKLLPYQSNNDEFQIMQAINNLVCLNPKSDSKESLLHVSCSSKVPIFTHSLEVTFPSFQVVKLLLKAGACPNAKDNEGNTSLHKIALNIIAGEPIFNLLLDNGAHLDFQNKNRKCALDLLPPGTTLNINPLRYLNLKCISAQVVRKANIPFHNLVPRDVENILNDH